MIGNSIIVPEGTFALVNEGGYSSEYRLAAGGEVHTFRIRHSKEKVPAGGVGMDRHNVECTTQFPPSAEYPQGYVVQSYLIIRQPPVLDGTDVTNRVLDIFTFLLGADGTDSANLEKVLGWES